MTGSSAGVGGAIAHKLAAEGAAVIVHGRQAHAVNAVAQAISAGGGQAEGLTADLADPGDCAWLISRTLAGGDIDMDLLSWRSSDVTAGCLGEGRGSHSWPLRPESGGSSDRAGRFPGYPPVSQ